jgi:pyruvate/2-oxoglutarate dehydrogenase complex dihydrolipoamide dehydrogenase (E3) component
MYDLFILGSGSTAIAAANKAHALQRAIAMTKLCEQ